MVCMHITSLPPLWLLPSGSSVVWLAYSVVWLAYSVLGKTYENIVGGFRVPPIATGLWAF